MVNLQNWQLVLLFHSSKAANMKPVKTKVSDVVFVDSAGKQVEATQTMPAANGDGVVHGPTTWRAKADGSPIDLYDPDPVKNDADWPYINRTSKVRLRLL